MLRGWHRAFLTKADSSWPRRTRPKMPDRWTEWEDQFTTPACVAGAHGACPHMQDHGGGFNPRRLRMEFGALLCRCTCHSACPVIAAGRRMTVPWNVWYRSCTCPGSDGVG